MKKIIQILAAIALLIFIIISLPQLIEIIRELKSKDSNEQEHGQGSENIKKHDAVVKDLINNWEELVSIDSMEKETVFNRAKEMRYKATIDRLQDIRKVMFEFKNIYGYYTTNWDSLISVVSKKKLSFVEKDFSDYDQLRYIPVPGEKIEFSIVTAVIPSQNIDRLWVFEVRAHNNVILRGFDPQLIINLNDQLRTSEKYPGLKIGSIESDNGGKGNWE